MAIEAPQDWAEFLINKYNNEAPHLRLLKLYADGTPPMYTDVRTSQKFQSLMRKARRNYADTIVSQTLARTRLLGFRTGADGDENGDREARRIMRSSNLKTGFKDLHRNVFTYASGYSLIGKRASGKSLVTTHSPFEMVSEPDPLNPGLQLAAARTFHDVAEEVDVLVVWVGGEYWTVRRPHQEGTELSMDGFDWSDLKSSPSGTDYPPVVRYENENGQGEFEPHLDLLDSIHHLILQGLVIATTQAHKQRMVSGNFPTHDANDNEIDYDGVFVFEPGTTIQLPADAKITELGQAEMTGILSARRADLQDLSALTGTPFPALAPESANQSAQGAALTDQAAVFKAEDRQDRLDNPHARTMSIAFEIEGDHRRAELLDLEPIWAPAERYTLQEKADAASKSKDLTWRAQMSEVWQFSPQQIDAMEADRTAEQLIASALGGTGGIGNS